GPKTSNAVGRLPRGTHGVVAFRLNLPANVRGQPLGRSAQRSGARRPSRLHHGVGRLRIASSKQQAPGETIVLEITATSVAYNRGRYPRRLSIALAPRFGFGRDNPSRSES